MKILVTNEYEESSIINVIQYFGMEGNEYMLYTLNEVDGKEYTKVYAIKLLKTDKIKGIIPSEEENKKIVEFIKKYAQCKYTQTQFNYDKLDASYITNILLESKKSYNLDKKMTELLVD